MIFTMMKNLLKAVLLTTACCMFLQTATIQTCVAMEELNLDSDTDDSDIETPQPSSNQGRWIVAKIDNLQTKISNIMNEYNHDEKLCKKLKELLNLAYNLQQDCSEIK